MTAFQKYQIWLMRSRDPALLTPVIRFWVGIAFMMTCVHLGLNVSHIFNNWSLIALLPMSFISAIAGIMLPQVVFHRYVGEMNLGQAAKQFNLPLLSRASLMGLVYGLIAFRFSTSFDFFALIKLPSAILVAGFIFEITLGQLAIFKPATSPSEGVPA